MPGWGTRGRQLAAREVEKVHAGLAAYQEFAAMTEQIVEVSEAICEARPAAGARGGQSPPPEGQRGASETHSPPTR